MVPEGHLHMRPFQYHLKEHWRFPQSLDSLLPCARCLMSLIGLLASTEKMVPEGRLHMRPFQFHLKEHWKFPQLLNTLLPWTETTSSHLEWWHNPTNVMKGLYRRLKQRLGHSLRASLYKASVVRCSRAEGGFAGPSKVQGPGQNQTVLVATDNSTVVAYINE